MDDKVRQSLEVMGIDPEKGKSTEQKVLEALIELCKETGDIPTRIAIAERAGISANGTISHHLRSLISQGKIFKVDKGRYVPNMVEDS